MLYRDVIDVGVARVTLDDDDRSARALASGVSKTVLLLSFFCIGTNGAAGGSSNVRSDVRSLSTSNRCES